MNKIPTPKNDLAPLIHYFFQEYLPTHKGISLNTIKSYTETFKLFLPWLIQTKGVAHSQLLSDITPKDVLEFLKHLESERSNLISTRNSRLAAIKTFFLMCYLLRPETKSVLEAIQFIPMKKTNTPLIDYFEHEDVMKLFKSIDQSTTSGMKDYLILNILYDTGIRASELAGLKLSGFDSKEHTLEIFGKGNKWRKIRIWPRTSQLISNYIQKWRETPKPLYHDFLIINYHRSALTRFGIHKICQKYLKKAGIQKQLPSVKRSAVHSWRHTAAVNMIRQGRSLLEVKVRLGHASFDSTQKYLNLDLSVKRKRVEEFVRFTENLLPSRLGSESEAWKSSEEILRFLKSV